MRKSDERAMKNLNRLYTKRGRSALAGVLAMVLLLGPALSAPTQTAPQRFEQLREPPVIAGETVADPTQRLQLATADSSYPVTPGDIYRITYLRAGEVVASEVTVENDYTINLNVFGQINAEGLSFAELRPRIESIVEQAIPRSLPSLSLVSVGVFQVRLTGALPQSRTVTAWGLSRLSDVVREHLAPYSSIRTVTVISRTGERNEFDLFRAIDLGDESQDPFVRPGDTVQLVRTERVVHVGGEVNQRGRIELAEGETMREIMRFVRGTTNRADLTRVRVTRYEGKSVRTYFIDISEDAGTFELEDADVIRIPSRITQRPVVYLEGQISPPPTDLDGAAPDAPDAPVATDGYNRAVVPIGIGETLYGVLDRMYTGISSRADLQRAQLMRDGRAVELPVSFETLIYDYSPEYDVELQPFDRIVIPRDPSTPPDGEPSVLITGGVAAPGQYPVLAGMDAFAHIRQAGGFDRELNTNESFRVYDSEGNRKSDDAPIAAGDHIEVLRNNFVYNFNRHFPIVATGVGFLATIVATLALFGP